MLSDVSSKITTKTTSMQVPADIVSQVLLKVSEYVEPGISTMTLNNLAEKEILRLGAVPYNKGYLPEWATYRYPFATCISVNDEIAHGFPSEYKLKDGDLVNIDIGVEIQGVCGDAALTLPVGSIAKEDEKLLQYAKKALYAGIDKVSEGVWLWEIARAIEDAAGWGKFVVNRQLVGHGIGDKMHETPHIYHVTNHYVQSEEAYKSFEEFAQVQLKAGQVICLEPQLTFSDRWGKRDKNEYTFKTRDGRKSAFFEHMILVKQDGYEILTSHISPYKV